jgi:hypothetical protein
MKRNELRPRQFLIDPAEMRRPALPCRSPAVPLDQGTLPTRRQSLARYGTGDVWCGSDPGHGGDP